MKPEYRAIIRTQLQLRGNTQADMARSLGISQKHLSLVLNGHADVRLTTLQAMLEYVGLELVITFKSHRA